MKIVRESNSEVSQNTPPNENCHRVQIQGVPEYPPKMKIVIESKSEVSQNTPPKKLKTLVFFPKSKFHVTQNTPPKMKIVIESKSKVSQNTPQNENCQRVQIRGVPEYPPKKLKTLVFFPKSKFRVTQNTPPNENCHRVQIWGVPE